MVCHANIGEVENAAPDTAMGLIIATIDSTDLRVRRYVPFHTERVFEDDGGNSHLLPERGEPVGPSDGRRTDRR